jgi:thiol:disulfide interchange protein DsbA
MLTRLLLIALLLPTLAFADDFVAGKDYELVNGSSEAQSNNKIAVTEFFSYGCSWCYRIEPSLTDWVKKQGDNIQFSRIPVVFNKDWAYYAKAYYTAHLLGLESALNPVLFKAVQDNKQLLNTNQAMINFFTAQGVENAIVKAAFENSTIVDMQITAGTASMARFHVNGVPAIVVNNQYKTDLQIAQNETRLFKILDFLLAKSRKKA